MCVDEYWDVVVGANQQGEFILKDIPTQVCVSHRRPLISKLGN